MNLLKLQVSQIWILHFGFFEDIELILIKKKIEKCLVKNIENENVLLQNSMAIRFASCYLAFSGSELLKLGLQAPVLSLIQAADHSIYEVDPKRLFNVGILQENIRRVEGLCRKFLSSIFHAGQVICPKFSFFFFSKSDFEIFQSDLFFFF